MGGSWIFLLIKLSADGRDTGCGGTSVIAADSLAVTSAAVAVSTATISVSGL